MTITEPTLVKKREITSGTREWADRNINCIKGCSNNCRYCYAKLIAKRFGRCTEDTWKDMKIRSDILNKGFGKYAGRVMFPSSHDITDDPEVKQACFIVIRKLLEAGNALLITSKPRLSITKDIVKTFRSFESQLQFRFTITSKDNQLLSFWEPGAPLFEERLRSLKYAHKAGFKTSVSIEPFLDYQPRALVEALSPFVTESIWLGPMNYIPRNGISNQNRQQYEEIRERYGTGHLREIHEDLSKVPKIRFKDSMNNRLGLSAETFKAGFGDNVFGIPVTYSGK